MSTIINNFLANGGTELNTTSNLYDLDFRNYDPALGRMYGVDPMASKYSSLTPYNYSFNNPIGFNDPTGADPPSNYFYNGAGAYGYPGYTYDDVVPPTARGDYNCAMCWRENQAGALANYGAIAGYGGSMNSWQSSTFDGVKLTRYGQMVADARAVQNGSMSVGEYAARYGSNPTSSDLSYIAGKLGLTITGTGDGNLYSTFVIQAALMDGNGNHLANQVNGVSIISMGIGKGDVIKAWRDTNDAVKAGSNWRTPWFFTDGFLHPERVGGNKSNLVSMSGVAGGWSNVATATEYSLQLESKIASGTYYTSAATMRANAASGAKLMKNVGGPVLGSIGIIYTGVEAYQAHGTLTAGDWSKIGVGALMIGLSFSPLAPLAAIYGVADIAIGISTGYSITDRIGIGVDYSNGR